jgi:acetyl/propionyl-CoA carboxylase alpha subunit
VITPDFDPLLAKLVVHAPTRDLALARVRQALRDFVILGLRTNIGYLLRVLSDPDVHAGAIHTGWLAANHDRLTAPEVGRVRDACAAVGAHHRRLPFDQQRGSVAAHPAEAAAIATPWTTLGAWRG